MDAKKEYYKPSVTADALIFRRGPLSQCQTQILLIRRAASSSAFPCALALPGGFMDAEDTSLEECCRREVLEETGLKATRIKCVGVWSRKGRDPRGPVHSTAFNVFVSNPMETKAGDDAAKADWYDIAYTCVNFTHYVMLTSPHGSTVAIEIAKDGNGNPTAVSSSGIAFDHADMIVRGFLALEVSDEDYLATGMEG